jgi:hypothetical protein
MNAQLRLRYLFDHVMRGMRFGGTVDWSYVEHEMNDLTAQPEGEK